MREAGDRYRVHLGDIQDVVITNHVWVEHEAAPDDGGGCGCRAGAGGSGIAGVLVLVVVLVMVFGRRRGVRRTHTFM